MSIVNASGWQTTRLITLKTKQEFLYCLIKGEVVLKCLAAMDALVKGLERLGLVTLRKHPKELRELFVFTHKPLDAETFVALMEVPSMQEPDMHVRAYKWFLEYVKERIT